MASDIRLIQNDVLFLTELQSSSDSDLEEIKNVLDKFIISFNVNDHHFSSLTVSKQNSTNIQRR